MEVGSRYSKGGKREDAVGKSEALLAHTLDYTGWALVDPVERDKMREISRHCQAFFWEVNYFHPLLTSILLKSEKLECQACTSNSKTKTVLLCCICNGLTRQTNEI